MAQYHVLASEGRQRYSVYTKNPKNIQEKKNLKATFNVVNKVCLLDTQKT